MKLRIILTFVILAISSSLQAQPKALAELFSNFNCGNCRTPDDQYETYLSSHPGVIVINYHNTDPDPNDKFYLEGLPSTKDRNTFYGGTTGLSDPSAYIDGIFAGSGKDAEPQWATFTTSVVNHGIPTITPIASIDGQGIVTIKYTVNGGAGTQVKAYVALTESNIIYPNTTGAYGPTPGDLWNNIFRGMIISDPFSFAGSKDFTATFDPQNFSLYSDQWNIQNMTAVVFVQDVSATTNNSRQVEALGQVSLAGLSGVESTAPRSSAHLVIPANPLARGNHLGFQLPTSGKVTITLSNITGSDVRTFAEGMMPEGQASIELENSLPAGCYIARLFVDGLVADQQKVIVLP